MLATEFWFGKVEMRNFMVFKASVLIMMNIIRESSMKSIQ